MHNWVTHAAKSHATHHCHAPYCPKGTPSFDDEEIQDPLKPVVYQQDSQGEEDRGSNGGQVSPQLVLNVLKTRWDIDFCLGASVTSA